MFSKFLSLSQDRQDRILNAALNQFAENGYQNASTNEMVKEAEISKGLLFHYFSNKKNLYLYLYEYFVEVFSEKIYVAIDWEDKDIFSRYRNIALLKFELFQQYPEMFNFLKSVFTEESPEVKGDIEHKNKEILASTYEKLFADIDYSLFKEGIDIKKAINVINWTLEGFAYQQQEKVTSVLIEQLNIDDIMIELDGYIEILKKTFYWRD